MRSDMPASLTDARADFIEIPTIVPSAKPDLVPILPLLPKAVAYDGVVPASERTVLLAAALASELNLPGAAADPQIFRDKEKMRARFAEAGVPQPAIYAKIGSPADVEKVDWRRIVFPVIVKPIAHGGSIGVRRCESKEEVLAHLPTVSWAQKNIFTGVQRNGVALVEEFVDGREYSAECIVHQGRVEAFFITEKFVSPFPGCHEIGHLMRGDAGIELGPVGDMLERVVSAWGVRDTVMHAEFKMDPRQGLRVIEVGNRVGGDAIPRLAHYRHGWVLEEAFLRLRCGLDPRAAFRESDRSGHEIVGVRFYFDGDAKDDVPAGLEVLEEKWYPPELPEPAPDRYLLFNRLGQRIFGARDYALASAYIMNGR
jgi:biotin carboxylase